MQKKQRQEAVSSNARRRSRTLPADLLRHLEGFRLGPDDRVMFFFLERFYQALQRRGREARMMFADNAAGLSQIYLDNRLGFRPGTGEPIFMLDFYFYDASDTLDHAEQILRQYYVDNKDNHDRCMRFLCWVLRHLDPAIINDLMPPPDGAPFSFTERRSRGESIENILQNNWTGFRSDPPTNRMLRQRYGGVVDVPMDFFLYMPLVEERLRRLTVPQSRDPTLAEVSAQTRRLGQRFRQQTFATRQQAFAALRAAATHDIVPGSFEAVKTGDGRYALRPRQTDLERQLQCQRTSNAPPFDDYEGARAELDRRLQAFLGRIDAVDGSERSHAIRAFQDALGIKSMDGRFFIAPRQRGKKKSSRA